MSDNENRLNATLEKIHQKTDKGATEKKADHEATIFKLAARVENKSKKRSKGSDTSSHSRSSLSNSKTKKQKFQIDQVHSSVEFSVLHLGLFPVKGRFGEFQGGFHYDAKTRTASHILFTVEVDSIDTNEKDRDAHLRGPDFFHVRDEGYDLVRKNRHIVFKLDRLQLPPPQPGKKKNPYSEVLALDVKGSLSIVKATRSVSFPSKVKIISSQNGVLKIGIQLEGKINRKHYGLNWDQPATGFLKKAAGKLVGDWVKISVNALFQPEKKEKTSKK